ncbi:Signal transduction histidine kinase, TMAO sensor TorS [Parasponia andersonii]|uniref:histidine kinase n=1 Tax=Parasponia andersonii TaxID=3476 RepID=A0A2P5DEV6_PARAD|nr:Signal transduction histidine kinase, TMAO sensor TorS [Parasponia andersonii]
MKLISPIVVRLLFVIFLAIVLLLLLGLMTPCWYGMIKRVKNNANLSTQNLHSQVQSQIEKTTKFFNLASSSTPNLARLLNSSLNGSDLSFLEIENKVAPFLFQALVMTPYLSQISYIGSEGLLFSYSIDGNQTFAVYSNSSSDTNWNNYNVWYKQTADRDTGKPFGNAVRFSPLNTVNASWFTELALNSMNGSYGFLGTRWDNGQDLLFLNSATVNDGKGLISFGFLAKELTDEYYADVDLQGGGLYLATAYGKVLVDGIKETQMVLAAADNVSVWSELVGPNGDRVVDPIGNVTCYRYGASSTRAILTNIQGTKYNFYCSPLDIIGVQSVYVLALPQSDLINYIHKHSIAALIFLLSIVVITIVLIFSFVFINVRDSIVENYLRAALIKQMEATKQAQKKSNNQNLAFARASHDIRAPLAGISGLIDLSFKEVSRGSELETNLRQMDACTNDLLGILNSILDTSKIEAGKMLLEEEEFEMAQLLEELIDFYHPVGANSEVDMILDPYDGSVIKFSHVKGDRVKLKQILCNLLSNAIKCTPNHGHVVLRAWARKPSLMSSINPLNRRGIMHQLSRMFYKNKAQEEHWEALNMVNNDPNVMEFVFEVDDTGKGIPKEKQKDLFENYVQDKETFVQKGGTGLGLGIVKSLVQLMHGEIRIVDKDVGEKGTCFRFNVLLSVCGEVDDISSTILKENQNELDARDFGSASPRQLRTLNLNQRSSIRTPNYSPSLNVLTRSPKLDASYVVLLIQNHERRRVSQKFMKRLGIKALVVEQWEQLHSTLKKIKYMKYWNSSSNYKSDSNIQLHEYYSSNNSSATQSPYHVVEANKDVSSLSSTVIDESNYILSLFKRDTTNYHLQGTSGGFVLMVMDANAGPISQLLEIVNEFKNGLRNIRCQVVWLAKPLSHSMDFFNNSLFDPDDIIMYKPFHGTRLYQVVRLLPEFRGSSGTQLVRKAFTRAPTSSSRHGHEYYTSLVESEIQEVGSPSNEMNMPWNNILSPSNHEYSYSSYLRSKSQFQYEVREKHGESSKTTDEKPPFSGKKILVVDDSSFSRDLSSRIIVKHGGTTDLCSDGKEAFELVSKELANQIILGYSITLPYDCILMDCEMKTMNGYEATIQIRKMEKSYGVHIPIIGLTAHTMGSEEANRTIEAGMDACLSKPLNHHDLIEAIIEIKESK